MGMLVVSDIFRQDSRSVLLLSHFGWIITQTPENYPEENIQDHYTVGKTVDQVSDVLWSKLSSKHLTVPDHGRLFGYGC